MFVSTSSRTIFCSPRTVSCHAWYRFLRTALPSVNGAPQVAGQGDGLHAVPPNANLGNMQLPKLSERAPQRRALQLRNVGHINVIRHLRKHTPAFASQPPQSRKEA